MEVFYLNHPHHMQRDEFPPLVMALGFFDGVHLGHQKVILSAKKMQKKMDIRVLL